jgi:hypothetical protein
MIVNFLILGVIVDVHDLASGWEMRTILSIGLTEIRPVRSAVPRAASKTGGHAAPSSVR